MSEEKKRQLRTQGRYLNNCETPKNGVRGGCQYSGSGGGRKYSDRRSTPPEDKCYQPSRKYEFSYAANSHYNFEELDKKKRPKEILLHGEKELSITENGQSRIFYEPLFFDDDEGNRLFFQLEDEIQWEDRKILIRGVERPQPRLVAWFGPLPYMYSGLRLEPKEMPEQILRIKEKVEEYLLKNRIPVKLNSVLANLYRDGKDSVAWHSDDELSMGIQPTIASVSLGAPRTFQIRRKPLERHDDSPSEWFIKLTHGSLLIMDGVMQQDWEHRVPKENSSRRRINLTFRTVHPLERKYSPKSYIHMTREEVKRKSCLPKYDDKQKQFKEISVNRYMRINEDICKELPKPNNLRSEFEVSPDNVCLNTSVVVPLSNHSNVETHCKAVSDSDSYSIGSDKENAKFPMGVDVNNTKENFHHHKIAGGLISSTSEKTTKGIVIESGLKDSCVFSLPNNVAPSSNADISKEHVQNLPSTCFVKRNCECNSVVLHRDTTMAAYTMKCAEREQLLEFVHYVSTEWQKLGLSHRDDSELKFLIEFSSYAETLSPFAVETLYKRMKFVIDRNYLSKEYQTTTGNKNWHFGDPKNKLFYAKDKTPTFKSDNSKPVCNHVC